MRRVLVTRPKPGASRTADRLRKLGFEPVSLPLSETIALPVDPGILPRHAAVAVTSVNAVRHAPKALIAAFAALPCHAVGKMTAQAARAAGFRSVAEGPGDAAGLADEMAASFAGEAIVYMCGRLRFPLFEQRLRTAGVGVDAIETYDTVALSYPDHVLAERLAGKPVDAVLLYSAKAADAARTLSMRPEFAHLFDNTMFFALSGRIAAALDDRAHEKIHVASTPDEEALLALLASFA